MNGPAQSRRRFVLRRLHSLTGIVPIGAYLFAHIFLENSFVLGGPASFERLLAAVAAFPTPLLLTIEVLLSWGPLLIHAIYGFVRVADAELDNPLRTDYLCAYLYTLQRLSGVVAFLFIGWHVWSTRLQYYFHGTEITYAFMRGMMTDPLRFSFFVIGVLACVFHFTNGIWTFAITWGITVGQRAQRTLRVAALSLCVVMYGTALAIMMAFRA